MQTKDTSINDEDDRSEHKMAVSIATYGDRGWFVDNHNVLVDMYEGDRLAGHRYFVPARIHTSATGAEEVWTPCPISWLPSA